MNKEKCGCGQDTHLIKQNNGVYICVGCLYNQGRITLKELQFFIKDNVRKGN